jgi:C_GCAxxG_C_C family probable redox protein
MHARNNWKQSDMLSKDETTKLAEKYAEGGFLCSESVLMAIADCLNISSDLIPKIATGFGAGIGRRGEACGALAGGVMALGLRFGRSAVEETQGDRRPYWFSTELADTFRGRFGAIRCRDLLGLDLSKPEDLQIYREKGLWNTTCRNFIIEAAEIVYELLQKHMNEK